MLSHSVESAVERDNLKQSSWVRRATRSDKEKFRDFSAATKLNVRKFPLDFFLSERKNRAHKKMSAPMSLPKTTENKKVFSSESRFTRKSETVEHNLALWLPKRGSLDRRVHRSLNRNESRNDESKETFVESKTPKMQFCCDSSTKVTKVNKFPLNSLNSLNSLDSLSAQMFLTFSRFPSPSTAMSKAVQSEPNEATKKGTLRTTVAPKTQSSKSTRKSLTKRTIDRHRGEFTFDSLRTDSAQFANSLSNAP